MPLGFVLSPANSLAHSLVERSFALLSLQLVTGPSAKPARGARCSALSPCNSESGGKPRGFGLSWGELPASVNT